MAHHRREPVAETDRLQKRFCLAAETTPDISRTVLDFQTLAMTRRFGVPPATALALAPLVFGEVRQ